MTSRRSSVVALALLVASGCRPNAGAARGAPPAAPANAGSSASSSTRLAVPGWHEVGTVALAAESAASTHGDALLVQTVSSLVAVRAMGDGISVETVVSGTAPRAFGWDGERVVTADAALRVYARSGRRWGLEAELPPANGDVAISGRRLIAGLPATPEPEGVAPRAADAPIAEGSPSAAPLAPPPGAARVYRLGADGWAAAEHLWPADASYTGEFGGRLALTPTHAFVSADEASRPRPTAAGGAVCGSVTYAFVERDGQLQELGRVDCQLHSAALDTFVTDAFEALSFHRAGAAGVARVAAVAGTASSGIGPHSFFVAGFDGTTRHLERRGDEWRDVAAFPSSLEWRLFPSETRLFGVSAREIRVFAPDVTPP